MTKVNRNYYSRIDTININGKEYVRQTVFFSTVNTVVNDRRYYEFKKLYQDDFFKIGNDIFIPTDVYQKMVGEWPEFLRKRQENKHKRVKSNSVANINLERLIRLESQIGILERKINTLVDFLSKKGE